MRFSDPQSEADKRQGGLDPVRFDPDELRQRTLDPAAYGQYLAAQLLAEPARTLLLRPGNRRRPGAGRAAAATTHHRAQRARAAQPALGDAPPARSDRAPAHRREPALLPLPLQPGLAAGAPATRDRSARAGRRRRPERRPRSTAWPRWTRKAELAAARAGLGDIAAIELATRGQVTLNNMAARLRDGYDILYLVAHGMLVDGEPWLFLEKEDGTADRVPGRELVTRIQELDDRPRLVVLVSCQSAGAGKDQSPRRTTARSPAWGRGWRRRACRR